jgi:hypothetical protein
MAAEDDALPWGGKVSGASRREAWHGHRPALAAYRNSDPPVTE